MNTNRTTLASSPVSFTEEEFMNACEQLAMRNPDFCALHVECEQDASSRRLLALRDSNPFVAETIDTATHAMREAVETVAHEDDRPTLPSYDDRPTDVDDEDQVDTIPLGYVSEIRLRLAAA